jgi:hypothetical protein
MTKIERCAALLLTGMLAVAPVQAQQPQIVQGVLVLKPLPKYEGEHCPEGLYGFKIDGSTRELVLWNNITTIGRVTISPQGTFKIDLRAYVLEGDFKTGTFNAWTERRHYDCRYTFDFRECADPTVSICRPR